MEPVRRIQSRAMPLNRADVDTDSIIPAKYLKLIDRQGFGKYLFDTWKQDPDFVTNDKRYAGAKVLVAGPNFGCGSSREHAPWALEDFGFKAIIAPSFADIFRNNCAKIGLLTVVLDKAEVDQLLHRQEETPEAELIVDLESQTVSRAGESWSAHFEIDPFIKNSLLNGLDDIGLTLQHADEISAFESRRPAFLPALLPVE